MLATDIALLAAVERGEIVLETGLTYDGIAPVLVRVVKREGRFEFSDDGGAVAAAAVDPNRFTFQGRIPIDDCAANVSRQGVVWLPGFSGSSDQWLAKLSELVATGSLALYETLLELED
jgi:hypothetical protein